MPWYGHAHRRDLGTIKVVINGSLQEVPLNHEKGENRPRLLIVHIMQGSLSGTDSWFHNPKAKVSAHFGVGRDGTVLQWVDTDDRAWHAVDANDYSIGVECEGLSGEPLTDRQIQQVAHIFAWAHTEYEDVELWMNRRPYSGHGLSYHALGGFAWGNHPNCPGAPIVHQLPEILAEAEAIAESIKSDAQIEPIDIPKAQSPSATESNSQETDSSSTKTPSANTPSPESTMPVSGFIAEQQATESTSPEESTPKETTTTERPPFSWGPKHGG